MRVPEQGRHILFRGLPGAHEARAAADEAVRLRPLEVDVAHNANVLDIVDVLRGAQLPDGPIAVLVDPVAALVREPGARASAPPR